MSEDRMIVPATGQNGNMIQRKHLRASHRSLSSFRLSLAPQDGQVKRSSTKDAEAQPTQYTAPQSGQEPAGESGGGSPRSGVRGTGGRGLGQDHGRPQDEQDISSVVAARIAARIFAAASGSDASSRTSCFSAST